jgi:NitT/TauT family transport system substrate-binding protein
MLALARIRPLLALSVALAIVAACTPATPPAPAPAGGNGSASAAAERSGAAEPAATALPVADEPLSPPVDVKLAIFGTVGDAPFYVAIERGYFRAEGLNVETVQSDSAPRIIPFLASGQVDVAGLSQSPALFNAVGRGVPIKVVADKGRPAPGHDYAAIVVRKDLVAGGAVLTYADLRGLRIATPGRGTAMWGLLARALEIGGLTLADVQLEELSQPDSLPALGNRALDVAMLVEPFVTAAVARDVGVRWKTTEEFAPGAQNGLVAYAPQFIENQPAAARRFMVAYLQGLRDYLDAFDLGIDQEEIVDILIKHTAVKDRAIYLTTQPSGFEPNGRVNVEYLRAEQELYAREGLLTDPVDVAALVDLQYADYAVARLGRR